MLATIITDVYCDSKPAELAKAIDFLCCPTDALGWSSAGIYCFWNYDTKEILYIGLASDLVHRFRQHNGLVDVSPEKCKRAQITQYFRESSLLGYSIFVQSPLAQPLVWRQKRGGEQAHGEYWGDDEEDIGDGEHNVRIMEGTLLRSYYMLHGRWPAWNKIGGRRTECKPGDYPSEVNLLNGLVGQEHPLLARLTIRNLANGDRKYRRYEENLHAIRMIQSEFGGTMEQAMNRFSKLNPTTETLIAQIVEAGYLAKHPLIPI
jgi:hypothetical protein